MCKPQTIHSSLDDSCHYLPQYLSRIGLNLINSKIFKFECCIWQNTLLYNNNTLIQRALISPLNVTPSQSDQCHISQIGTMDVNGVRILCNTYYTQYNVMDSPNDSDYVMLMIYLVRMIISKFVLNRSNLSTLIYYYFGCQFIDVTVLSFSLLTEKVKQIVQKN